MGPRTQWRGQADTADRRLRWLVLVSFLAHTPLTPVFALFGLFGWLSAPGEVPFEAPPITAIPVDLLEADEPSVPAPMAPAPPETSDEPVIPKKRPVVPRDAGVPDAAVGDSGASETADAGAGDAAVAGDAGDGGIGEPAAVSGDAKKVVDANANVRVLIDAEKIRKHPLGVRLGRLLGSIYQWRDFFGPAALDPIKDVDRILIVGSQLRDSSGVVAILKLNVPAERVRAAIDGIVAADPEHGAWLDAGIPAATAYADRAPRVFVMPAPDIVVVAPESARDSALGLGRKTTVPRLHGDEVLLVHLVTPWRAVMGLPVRVPKSIRWARLRVLPEPNGGVHVDIEAQDESPETASADAEELTRSAAALNMLDLGILGALLGARSSRFVERIEFTAEGDRIRGVMVATSKQIDQLIDFGSAFLAPRRRPPPRSSASSVAPPGAPEPAVVDDAGSGL